MKRKITRMYMVVFALSVAVIIVCWLALTYLFVLSGKVAENDNPQYLVNRFEQYVDAANAYAINEEGKKILSDHDLWAQIIDENGFVLQSYHVPDTVPKQYNVFQISNAAMNSDILENQTLFISQFEEHENYGVIIGCDSSKISKMNLKLTGGTKKNVRISLLILLGTFLIVGIGAGAFFSKNLAAPVHDIIENINGLESGQVLKKKKTDGIFTSVFDSLDKLKIRLMSADTERKNAENQRKEWITNVSHDMKTPLSTVKGYAELLMEDGYEISDAERKKYAEKIRNHAETIEKLIEELKFGRLLEDGKIKTQKEEIDLCKLLRECGSEIPFSEKENRLRLEFEKEPMYVTVDKQLMKRCFMNIIGNALVHNNGNAAITILCSQAEKTSIKICDNGKGMERDELSNIFDRYYRGKGAKKTAGSGLGLAIAKEIVQAHDGSITVESEVGKGTIFTITL